MKGAVGSLKPLSDPHSYEDREFEDQVRVQGSMVAYLNHRPGGWCYHWYLCHHRYSRSYRLMEDAIDAMRTQGFGAYVDLDDRRVRLR